jgi:hypothetical protein
MQTWPDQPEGALPLEEGGVRGEIGVPARECIIRVSKEKRKHSLRNTKIDNKKSRSKQIYTSGRGCTESKKSAVKSATA